MKKISTVVVTYNAEPWLNTCLESLLKSTVKFEKIIVVDNNSTDSTTEIIKAKYQSVYLVEKEQNLGFGKANNIGMQLSIEAGADYVFLLNQDAWIKENTISKILPLFENNPEYGLISPVHLNSDGTHFDYNFEKYLCESRDNNFFSDIYTKNIKKDTPYAVNYVNAAAWLLTSPCIQKVGGFDPIFYHYGEDVDFVQRLKYHGFKLGVVPNSIIYHGRVFDKSTKKRGDAKRQMMNGLVLLKNINKSFYSNLLNFTGYCLKNIAKGLLQANFKDLKYGAMSLVWFSIKIPIVLKSRKVSKNTESPFF